MFRVIELWFWLKVLFNKLGVDDSVDYYAEIPYVENAEMPVIASEYLD